MRRWWREASESAAISFGYRHSGMFAGLHLLRLVFSGLWWLLRWVVVPLAAIGGLVALVWLAWRWLTQYISPVLLVVILGAVVITVLARMIWLRRYRSWWY